MSPLHSSIQDESETYFQECVECALSFQETQELIKLFRIMFRYLKEIIVFRKLFADAM